MLKMSLIHIGLPESSLLGQEEKYSFSFKKEIPRELVSASLDSLLLSTQPCIAENLSSFLYQLTVYLSKDSIKSKKPTETAINTSFFLSAIAITFRASRI